MENKSKYKIFLFWSRAKWNYNSYSDYDIWILWDETVPYSNMKQLRADFEIIPYNVDIVDFKIVDEEFKKFALQNIISL